MRNCAILLSIATLALNLHFFTHITTDVRFKLYDIAARVLSVSNDSDIGEKFKSVSHPRGYSVVIGLAITSKGVDRGQHKSSLEHEFMFFNVLLYSFCKTSSHGFSYRFYLAYDQVDGFFVNRDNRELFHSEFERIYKERCNNGSEYTLNFIECPYKERPAWAQNDAMWNAYEIENADFYFRVNDDTMLLTPGWSETFIQTLFNYTPPLIGVVGPKHHNGNGAILTHDFVHKTHMDIFGFYYPRIFTDWFADAWMSKVYLPRRYTKLASVRVEHTMAGGLGMRYTVSDISLLKKLNHQILLDKQSVKKFLNYFRKSTSKVSTAPRRSV